MTDKFKEAVKNTRKRIDEDKIIFAELMYTKKQLCEVCIKDFKSVENLVDSIPMLFEIAKKKEDLICIMKIISLSYFQISFAQNVLKKIRNCEDVSQEKKYKIFKKIRSINEKARVGYIEYLRKYGKNEREEFLK